MSDINRIAAAFLREIEGGTKYVEEKITPEPIAAFTGLVALRCPVKKQFFAGFKASGRAIFTHEIRLAKSFHTTQSELEQHIDRLEAVGENVLPITTVWYEGKHKNDAQL